LSGWIEVNFLTTTTRKKKRYPVGFNAGSAFSMGVFHVSNFG
jgi:hypothetical protein